MSTLNPKHLSTVIKYSVKVPKGPFHIMLMDTQDHSENLERFDPAVTKVTFNVGNCIEFQTTSEFACERFISHLELYIAGLK